MKNYLSKIKNLNFQKYFLTFKEKNPFSTIILSIIFVFLSLLYFTIPAFYNYENYGNKTAIDDSSGKYHIYSLVWNSSFMEILLDNKVFLTMTNSLCILEPEIRQF